MTSSDLKDILTNTKNGHYHIACTRVFELQHAKLPGGGEVPKGEGIGGGDSVDHPNRYFDASRKAIKEAQEKVEKVKGEEGGEGDERKPATGAKRIVKGEDRMEVDH